MATYSAISDTETAPGQPAFASVARRQRDNLKALAEGDASVPQADRFTPGSFKSPTAATQTAVIAHQGPLQLIGDINGTIQFFQATVYVGGVYTFAGTRSSTALNTVQILVNDSVVNTPSTASFDYQMTLAAGDRIRVSVDASTSGGIDLTNFRLLSEFLVPMCQCHFNRFKPEQSA